MAVIIKSEKCIGCGICVKECPLKSVTMIIGTGGKKVPNICSSCNECGRCVEACPKAAITSIKNGDIDMYHGVWVYAEQCDGKLADVTIELLGEGRRLADEIGTELGTVLVGSECNQIEKLFACGADRVYYAYNPLLKEYTTDGYSAAVYHFIQKYKPMIVLFGATRYGSNLASYMALKCGVFLAKNCTKLDIDPMSKDLRWIQPGLRGSGLFHSTSANKRPQMATVRPGIMAKPEMIDGRKGELIDYNIKFKKGEIRIQQIIDPSIDFQIKPEPNPWSFVSYTNGWAKCIENEKAYWEKTDRNLSRALRYAKGDTAQEYRLLKDKILSVLETNRAESSAEDERKKNEIIQRYTDGMEKAEQSVAELYAEAVKRRQDDYECYCRKQENARTAKEYAEAAALFDQNGMRGFEDCDERVKQCSAIAKRLIQEEKRLIEEKQTEKLREGMVAREQERNKLKAEIERLSMELAQTKGLFAGKRKKELEDQIMLAKSKLQKL